MPRAFPTPLSPGVIFCFNPDGNLRLSGKSRSHHHRRVRTDFSGYPDCRDEFVKALHHAVSLGMAKDIRFETPLMWLNKAETWALADYWGQLDLVRRETLTCYNGIRAMAAASAPPVTCAQTDSTSIWRTRSG